MNSLIYKIKKRRERRKRVDNAHLSEMPTNDWQGLSLHSPEPVLHQSPSFTRCSLSLVENHSPEACSSSNVQNLKLGLSRVQNLEFEHSPVQNLGTDYGPAQNLGADLGPPSPRHAELNLTAALLNRKSCLPRCLMDALNDPTALGHFLTYMESQNLRHLVKFWLDAETFRVSTLAVFQRMAQKHSLNDDGISTADNSQCDSLVLIQMIEQDAVAIFSKYLSKEASDSIGITNQLRDEIIDKICLENGKLDAECFLPAQQFILKIIETRYYPAYLKSVHYCKLLLEILSQHPVYITDILFDETALFHFIEFMEQENRLNLVEFWLSARNWREKFESIDDRIQAQKDAMILYNRYLSLQATTPIEIFGNDFRISVENEICNLEGGGPRSDCFEPFCAKILLVLEKEYLPKFLASPLFAKLVAELTSTINNDLELPNLRQRKYKSTGGSSTCSSISCKPLNESRICLAKRPSSATSGSECSISQIDAKMYDDNPDSLWKRDKLVSNLGHVDLAGNYVTHIERPTDFRKAKGTEKIRNKVKKMFGDAKEEELLAEQVAALIVQDVQNMTKFTNGV